MFKVTLTQKDLSLGVHGKVPNRIVCISGNSAGSRIAYARTDCSLRGYILRGSSLASPFSYQNAHPSPISSISWGVRNDLYLATVAGDQCIKIWKIKGLDMSCAKTITAIKDWDPSSTSHIDRVAFSNDGLRIISIDRDSTVMVFDAVDFSKLGEIRINVPIHDFQWFHSGSEHVMFALENGAVQIYRIDSDASTQKAHIRLSYTIGGHCSAATCVAMDRGGHQIFIGTDEGLVSIFGCTSLLCTNVISDVDDGVTWVVPGGNGSYVAIGYGLTAAKVYNAFSGDPVCDVPDSKSENGANPCGYWLPHADVLVYASKDCTALSVLEKKDEHTPDMAQPPKAVAPPQRRAPQSHPRRTHSRAYDARDRNRIRRRDDRRAPSLYPRHAFRRDEKRF